MYGTKNAVEDIQTSIAQEAPYDLKLQWIHWMDDILTHGCDSEIFSKIVGKLFEYS